MQAVGITTWWPWFVGLSLLALVGLFLIWRGLRPRRTGTTPYCRKCGYNLTGTDRTADEARCPECGSNVSDDAGVVFGERTRRWRRVVLGSAAFLLGAVPLAVIATSVARGIDWYRYKPTGLVIRDLQSGNNRLAGKGAREITRRYLDGSISTAQVHKLAEVCLAEQRRPSRRFPVTQALIDLLGGMYERAELSQHQVDRFFENLCVVAFVARPTVIRGRDCPVEFRWESRAPSTGVWAILARGYDAWSRDYLALFPRRNITITGRSGSRGISRTSGPPRGPGHHELSLDVELRVYDTGIPYDEEISDPVRTIRRTLTSELQVLEDEPPDYIKLIRSPELDTEVRAAVRMRCVALDGDTLSCTIEICDFLPIGLAFDATAEWDGHATTLKPSITRAPRRTAIRSAFGRLRAGQCPEEITIVLKSSKEAAEGTVDLFEIWGGELRFENVKIEGLPDDTTP